MTGAGNSIEPLEIARESGAVQTTKLFFPCQRNYIVSSATNFLETLVFLLAFIITVYFSSFSELYFFSLSLTSAARVKQYAEYNTGDEWKSRELVWLKLFHFNMSLKLTQILEA